MKTIQEIARSCYESFEKDYTYNWRFAENQNVSKRLFDLIRQYTSDEYLFKFLQFSLDAISKICEIGSSTPEDMRLSEDWVEPDFTHWDSNQLWQWFISDSDHLVQVQEEIKISRELGIDIPDLNACIQVAVWAEWRIVFDTVKLYLTEEYEAQPEDEDEDEE